MIHNSLKVVTPEEDLGKVGRPTLCRLDYEAKEASQGDDQQARRDQEASRGNEHRTRIELVSHRERLAHDYEED